MKQLAHTILLFLFGINSFEIILVAGTIALLMQLLFSNISDGIKKRHVRESKSRIEEDMWAIE